MHSEGSFGQRKTKTKLLVMVLVAFFMVGVGSLWVGDGLSLAVIAQQESDLRSYQERHPALVYGFAFLFYVSATALSLPGASVLTLMFGWLFGLVPGLIVVSFASTSGASLAFLLSRYLFGRAIQLRYGHRLRKFNDAFARDGAFYLFTLRLVPAVPYTGVNLLMGLTPIELATFWWVSQLGMLPATFVYVSAGAAVPDLYTLSERGVAGVVSLPLLGAFALLGLFPWLARLILARVKVLQRRIPLLGDRGLDCPAGEPDAGNDIDTV